MLNLFGGAQEIGGGFGEAACASRHPPFDEVSFFVFVQRQDEGSSLESLVSLGTHWERPVSQSLNKWRVYMNKKKMKNHGESTKKNEET